MSALAMTRWPLAALLFGLSLGANASESTTRLRLPPEQAPPPALGAPTPPPAATPAAAPAAAPTSLRLRMPEQAKGAPIAPEPAGAPPSSVTLPDGTIAITASLLVQEMLKDGSAAVAKYRGRPIQFQGVLNYHLMNNNCQRRSKNASAGRSKNASGGVAERAPAGALSGGRVQAWLVSAD